MNRESEFRSDAEVLEAIRRTRAEMAPPAELEVREIVESATAAYWKAREQQLRGEPDLARDTMELARLAAYRVGGLRRQFVSDAVAVIVPVLVGLAFAYAESVHLLSPSSSRPHFVAAVIVGLIGLAGFVNFVWPHAAIVNRNRFWRSFARNSSGAAFASMFVAFFLYTQYSSAKKERLDNAMYQTQQTIVRAALTSIQDREVTGRYSELASSAHPVELSTSVLTPTRAVYLASTKDLPGNLKAELDTGGAIIYWDQDETAKQYRARLIVGRVTAAKDSSFLMEKDSGGSEWVTVSDPLIRVPQLGTRIAALLRARSTSALAVEPIAVASRPSSH